MALVIHYQRGPSDVIELGTVERATVRALETAADQGTFAQSVIDVPDKGGAITIVGLHRVYITEDDSPAGAQVIWDGYVNNRQFKRGPGYLIGSDRIISVNLNDLNQLLDARLIEDGVFNRPAETDIERIAALLDPASDCFPTAGGVNMLHDFGFVATTGGVNMDACDYAGQKGGDVIRDCAEHSGRNWFVYYDESQPTAARFALWYDFDSSPNWPCTIRLSNLPEDYDPAGDRGLPTFRLDPEGDGPIQDRDPGRIESAVRVPYANGSVMVHDTDIGLTTAADFYIKQVNAPSMNTKSATVATAMGTRLLRENDSEADSGSVTAFLPSTHVGLVKAGMRIPLRAMHFEPEYRIFNDWRINRLSLADTNSPLWYRARLQVTPIIEVPDTLHQVILSSRGNCGVAAYVGLTGTPNPMVFGGATGGGISFSTPTIVQDTDGFAQRIEDPLATADTGDPFGAPCYVTQIIIPATLSDDQPGDGLYRYSWGDANNSVANGLPAIYDAADIHGLPIVYAWSGGWTHCGATSTHGTITISVCVNGVPLPAPGTYTHTFSGFNHGDSRGQGEVRLVAGDVITLTAAYSVFSGLVNSIGIGVFGDQQGIFALTRIAD